MSHPDDEHLADMALGMDEVSPGAREHLERCQDCARAVAELRRTVALVSAGAAAIASPSGWETPPPRVWQHVASAFRGDQDSTTATVLPPGVVRADFTPRRRPPAWTWAAGMAAAGLAVGLLTGRALWQEAVPPTTTVAQAELDTLDTQQRLGAADVVRTGTGVTLRVTTTTALDAGDGYLEVWLINSDGKRMVSVGVLDAGSATFPISQTLLDQGYVVVDISKEPFDDRPEHSGDSLVRGTLPA